MALPHFGNVQAARGNRANRANRAETLQSLSNEIFDVLVIGGGITGAGTARDAAMRGLRVALVEKGDFASGTSGRSSRLIHGGIRYLEHGQFHLVRESSREKAILLEIAPHLVKLLRFIWPVYRGQRVPRWKLNLGLSVYDRMARNSGLWRHESLGPRDVLDQEPKLNPKDLLGGAAYFDATTDDSRLTLANIISAKEHGAVVANHLCAVKVNPGKPNGILVQDGLTSISFEVRARSVVDAVGPWATTATTKNSRGSHIAVARNLVGNNNAITLLSKVDGRVMFVLPSGDHAIIGTTDAWTTESPDTVRASRQDVDYLLRSARGFFPDTYISEDHVVAAWAGLRPLVTGNASTNPSAISREHRIARDRMGVIRVSGGKLTTYRSMAVEICDRVEHELGRRATKTTTDKESLPGAARPGALKALIAIAPDLAEQIVADHQASLAEAHYAATHELALTLSDILIRRTRIAFETVDHGITASGKVADIVAPLLGWTPDEKNDQLRQYISDTDRMFTIDAV